VHISGRIDWPLIVRKGRGRSLVGRPSFSVLITARWDCNEEPSRRMCSAENSKGLAEHGPMTAKVIRLRYAGTCSERSYALPSGQGSRGRGVTLKG